MLKNLVFIEKYRPNNFNEIVLSSEIKNLLKESLKNPKKISNFLFYSYHPGTGKTSVSKLIINELNCDNLILNASDERGIDTIRDKVKTFAQTMSMNYLLKRCVVLNEADGLTTVALQSLRDIMENYSNNVFFILTANNRDKIIEPIRSRCVEINFNNPPKEEIYNRLLLINNEEKLNIEKPDLENLIKITYPDIRKMILLLQRISLGEKIEELLGRECDFVQILELIKNKNYNQIVKEVLDNNLDIMRFINWFFDTIIEGNFSFNTKANICKKLILMEKFINEGVDSKKVFLAYIIDISYN